MTWEPVRLGDIVELAYGKALKAEDRVDGPFPVIGSGGIAGYHKSAIVQAPTIVVGRKGSIGSLTWAPDGCWPIDTSYYVKLKRAVDLRWLYWTMHSLRLDTLNKSAAVPGLNRDDAYRAILPLPPIEEQRRIAAILDEADATCNRRQRQVELIDVLRGARIERIAARATVYQELESLVDPVRPLTYGILKPGPDLPDGIPYVRVSEIVGRSIRVNALRRTSPQIATQYRRSTLQAGDLLMSIRGHVGRFAFVPDALAGGNITQDSARLAIVGANPVFVRAWLESEAAQRWMIRHTKGVAVRGINLGDVRRIPVPILDRRVQDEIATEMEYLDARQRRFSLSITGSADLFAALQHRAFRGEL